MLNNPDSATYERVQQALAQALADVLDRPELETERFSPDARLGDDVGLTSLDLAQLVALLEVELDADPFQALVPITSVRTIGDLSDAYTRYLAGERVPADDGGLEEVAARAAARRRSGRRR